jgi:UDP-N-acetylglucosamine--N-acetylmuramyl-(pentapeptide) pyrophosphoryl-undecaprenol N-acetylglucosamine transferase
MSYRILLSGGGSGGHVYPLVSVAQSLKSITFANNIELELLFLGEGDFAKTAAEEYKILYKAVLAGKFRRYFSPLIVVDFFKIIFGFFQALWHVYIFMPDVIFAKGGYASVLPSLVGRLYAIPVVIHESDSVPGLANKIISKWAKKIFVSFKKSAQYFDSSKVELVGNPVRKSLFNTDRQSSYQYFQLDSARKTILVLGGSQGAKIINDIVLASLVEMTKQYQIIHQCGQKNFREVKRGLDKILKEGEHNYGEHVKRSYSLYPFLNSNDMARAYAVADVVVSRAGSGLIFELASIGKPSVVIPIKNSSSNHQFYNALEFSESGASMIEEDNLTGHILMNQIEHLLNQETLESTKEKIKSFAKIDAGDKIAEYLLQASDKRQATRDKGQEASDK